MKMISEPLHRDESSEYKQYEMQINNEEFQKGK